ncbi:hypothetical protein RR46_02531 [Papilio xuthus]|uniref:PCNA-associated factor histone-like domain-containing protein n=1 Tax=Papilio xuthus TaxID=66420 RepID=A0A194Q223_PAPXU|nr:hypothetical protein RR46_02531 [Papilio xuthus]
MFGWMDECLSEGGSDRSSRSHSGGNPVCPRETPIWQRPITNFVVTKKAESVEKEYETPRSSKTNKKGIENNSKNDAESDDEEITKTKPKRNKILSDDEETPKNRELDESLILEPLTGENSHKIDEYYQKNNKGKGRGKKSRENNNIDDVKRNLKRDLEDITFGEESEHTNKKAKIE